MKVTIICESGRQMVIEGVQEASVQPNSGLIVGIGPNGMTYAITPQDLPTLVSSFNWAELLSRLFVGKK